MSEPIRDVAHIGHSELLTPAPEESLRFFTDVLGMEVEAEAGGSVYLRGWGAYQRYDLKLTESDTSGLGHLVFRAWSPEALVRRVDAIERSGRGDGWTAGDLGHGPAYAFRDPDGHPMEIYGLEPGGHRIEVTHGGYLVYDPEFEPVVWSEEERARGQAWGVQTVESFHTYGTPPVTGDAAPAPVASKGAA